MEYYVVDAFAEQVFAGNPAGVCVLTEKISADLMQRIAAENNLSETAFVYKKQPGFYDLRWFTPKSEINLCGHATLGSAFVIANFVDAGIAEMQFETLSGTLTVTRQGELFTLDFPTLMPKMIECPAGLTAALGAAPLEVYLDRDIMVLLPDQQAVADLKPDFNQLVKLTEGLGVIVTARGETADFISRCFYPKLGVDEDPVTGSAHCNLIPFWAAKLGKNRLVARQLSRRGGTLVCELRGERVLMSGKAALYSKATLFV
jgi:PhzF family phenazine biosynthesis protein